MATTVVFSGGPSGPGVSPVVASLGPGGSIEAGLVIAADSGLEVCLAAGLRPDVVVGDMDSVDAEALDRIAATGARIDRHPREKDAVDLELALEVALELTERDGDGGNRLLLIGSPAGRLDHLVTSMLLLGSPRYERFLVDAHFGTQRVLPVHSTRSLAAEPGSTVSLLALHGPGSVVTTKGLKWPLKDFELRPDRSLGVSNVVARSVASVEVSGPPVTVVLPNESPKGGSRPSDPAAPDPAAAPGGGAT